MEVELRKQVSQFKRDTSVAGEFAQGEIKPQKKADARSEREATLDRELQMQAKMRVKYPRIPAELEAEFLDRIKAGGFSWDSWGEAVKWLESTVWFTQHSKI